ncbi:hypothetical protein [Xanthobacter aminoxidans]|uniref:hypothetical protein n=1 Tax=Xanthobacter aminoxidans TaxID=186280 RepID=UPI003726465F
MTLKMDAQGRSGKVGLSQERRSGSSRSSRTAQLAIRSAGLFIAIAAMAWLWASIGVKRLDSGLFLRPVAHRMMSGEPYDPQILSAMDAEMSVVLSDPICDYQALQDLAIVRSALAEVAFQDDDADVADQRLTAAGEAAKASLACSPGSARAWTILAWIEHLRHEDTPLLHTYLNQSYRSGPFEGWSLVRRMEIQLALYPALSEAEFAELKRAVHWLIAMQMSEFIGEHYIVAKPEQRRVLRDLLAEAPERAQKRAAEFIRSRGEDIDLPLIEPLGSRPWK